MSARMREILLPRAPPHRLIPTAMIDFDVPFKKRLVNGRPAPGVTVGDFSAVQLLEHTAAMDLERSVFEPDVDRPGRARRIKQLTLADGALPWLFRLSIYPLPLFVSAEGRAALDAARVQGVRYEPLTQIVCW
jgi:hypothetical protein